MATKAASVTRTYSGGRTLTMTPATAEHLDTLGLTDPEVCLMCGQFVELPTMTEIKRPRARKADGHACTKCAPEALQLAAR